MAVSKPKPKPSYSPQTNQEIAEAMIKLALAGPRWIGEQMGEDLDEAFEIGETGISLSYFLRHPIKTFKKTLRKWTVSSWVRNLQSHLTAEFVWTPRLEHFVRQGKIGGAERDTILDWAALPESNARDLAFEKVEAERAAGRISDEVWEGVRLQHQWDEFSRFRRKPGRYLWDKVFGKRGNKEAPLYKLTPQKWLGEPLGKYLGQTRLGQAVEGVRQAAKRLVGRIVVEGKRVVRAAGRAAVTAARGIITRIGGTAAWTAISSAVGSAVGSIGGPVGIIIGAIAAPAVTKIIGWFFKLACWSCGCFVLAFVGFILLVIMVVGGAFHSSGTGGGTAAALVRVEKTANPHQVELVEAGETNPQVEFTIKVHNLSEEEISGGKIVDDFDENNVTLYVLRGGDNSEAGKIKWDVPPMPAGSTAEISYTAFVKANDGVDKVVVNRLAFTGTVEGSTVSDSTLAFVIVGQPTGQYPSGWPTNTGCISQGPGGSHSHTGSDAESIDIVPTTGDLTVYATHDGVAYIGYKPASYGNYVEVVSSAGFISRFAHLRTVSVQNGARVIPGQPLGIVGNTGKSTATHLHYQFASGLEMAPPYIPVEIERGCVEQNVCNLCFP